MSTKETGGPAFPYVCQEANHYSDGMTLRDWFATHASDEDIERFKFIGGTEKYIVENSDGTKSIHHRASAVSREEARYRFADAMLEARK